MLRFAKKKESKLIKQLLPILNVVMVCTTIICGILIYYFAVDVTLDFKRSEYNLTFDMLEGNIDYFGHTAWFIDYWKEHCDSMNIQYNGNRDLAVEVIRRERILDEAYKKEYGVGFFEEISSRRYIGENGHTFYTDSDFSKVNPEELTDEIQKYLAEYVYLYILDSFNDLKESTHLNHIYCVTRLSDTEMMYLFSGKIDGEIYGDTEDDTYRLGKIQEFPKSKYPAFYETYDTGKVITKEAIFESDRTDHGQFHFYYPIVDEDGNTMCVLAISGAFSNVMWLFAKPYLFMVFCYILAMLLCTFVVVRVLRQKAIDPINYIQNSIKAYTETRDSDELKADMGKINLDNEIGFLSTELADMGSEMTKYVSDITDMTKEKQKLATELHLATSIQMSSLQKDFTDFPKNWNLRIFASMTPAKTVGGDLYDYIPIDDDHIAFLIGDVSGKGIPAALFMMNSIAIFRNDCPYSLDPSETMTKANRTIYANNETSMFITVWLGILEVSTGLLKMTNAGHENPIIRRKNGRVEEITDKHDIVLAAYDEVEYRCTECTLEKGDMLVIYTDGVPEAINNSNEQYGVERLKKVAGRDGFDSPQEFVKEVKEDIAAFIDGAEVFDDTTIFAICYDGLNE